MSASSKKKLRKEQETAVLTERQRKEQKEAKKLKAYTVTFVTAMVAVLVIALVVMSVTFVKRSGVIEKNTVAMTVGEHEINSVVMNYYYHDMVTNAYNDWYEMYGNDMATYLSMLGLDLSKPLNKQEHMDGGTWDEYFINAAMEKAKSDYILYDEAMKNNYTLSDTAKENMADSLANMEFYAMLYGFSDMKQYLQNSYGFGSTPESFSAYIEKSTIAANFYNDYAASLTYDDAAIREYEKDKYDNYSSFTYAYYYLSVNSFLPEGVATTDATEEHKKVAGEAAKKAAEEVAKATSLIEMDTAIAGLEINKDVAESKKVSTKKDSELYTSTLSVVRDWLNDDSRKFGDIEVVPYEMTSKDSEGKETTYLNGYYVVFFQERDDNERKLANVRHLLVSPRTETDGSVTDANKKIAKEEADGYLKMWTDGAKTEESFIELVKEHSDDTTASTGGLFEGIHASSNFVSGFKNWAIDKNRKPGDAEVVETEYGYHVMYYVGDGEQTYRDYMISSEMRSAEVQEWLADLLESQPVAEVDLSRLDRGLVINPS